MNASLAVGTIAVVGAIVAIAGFSLGYWLRQREQREAPSQKQLKKSAALAGAGAFAAPGR